MKLLNAKSELKFYNSKKLHEAATCYVEVQVGGTASQAPIRSRKVTLGVRVAPHPPRILQVGRHNALVTSLGSTRSH